MGVAIVEYPEQRFARRAATPGDSAPTHPALKRLGNLSSAALRLHPVSNLKFPISNFQSSPSRFDDEHEEKDEHD
jgi:hypothetical protein